MSIWCVPLIQMIRNKCISNIKYVNRFMSSSTSLEKTSMYDFHVSRNGKMVNFAGYLLPAQYSDIGVSESHLHTRKCASVFDVSHMLQTYIRGQDAIECFESICTADLKGLQQGYGSLTVFTNDNGGILDDLIVTKVSSDCLYVVTNAGRKKTDKELMREAVETFKKKGKKVDLQFLETSEQAILAVQGPQAVKAVEDICFSKIDQLYFMQSTIAEIAGTSNCRITRCGYTGEDGVEISLPANQATRIAELLLTSKVADVKLAGLGVRNSLRIEAGMLLYGTDMDETITPVEAGLSWLIAKRRRTESNFRGARIILKQLSSGPDRRRVGIVMKSGPPARQGVKIYANNEMIGEITSGCPSPSLGRNIAMGYVKENFKKNGTKLQLEIRGKMYPAEVTGMPFVPSNYYKKPI